MTHARRALLGAALAVAVGLGPGCVQRTGVTLTDREQATLFVQKGTPEKAIPLLEQLHADRPSDVEIARALAEAYVKAGRAPELIAKVSARKPPLRAVDHYLLGLAYFSRTEDADARALQELEQAVHLSPDVAEFQFRRGLLLLEAERYETALPSLRRAAELNPDRAGYLLPLAKALSRTGDPKGAVAALKRFVGLSPTPAEVATARALMERLADPFAGFPRAAEAKLEEGLRQLHDLDRPQQAIIAFEEILRDHPDLAVIHSLLGLAYQRLDDAGRAVEELKQAITLAPEDGKNQLYLGTLYLSRQRPDAAREPLQRAIALNPLLDDAYARLAELELDRRELDAAREHLRILTSLAPDDASARLKLSAALQLSGDLAGAERALRQVVDRDPENVEAMLRLGLLHTERRRRAARPEDRAREAQEAETWLRKVLDAQPDNALASQALESLHTP